MSTKIEWTDETANYINGCTVYSPGCTNCYAMRLAGTRMKTHPTRAGLTIDTKAGPVWTGEVRRNEAVLEQVMRWGRGRMIFWNAHGDLFHESVPDEWIDEQFVTMALTPRHIHQVLTKRSDRMLDYMRNAHGRIAELIIAKRRERGDKGGVVPLQHLEPGDKWWPLANVWVGVSVEDQTRADERLPDLLQTPAAVRWVSAEPLLGAVNFREVSTFRFRGAEILDALTGTLKGMFGDYCPTRMPKIDWIVVGGESGRGARPMHPAWAGAIRDQCHATYTPFLFKQNGEYVPVSTLAPLADGTRPSASVMVTLVDRDGRRHTPVHMERVGKKAAGRLLDGVIHDGYPA